MVKQKHRQDMLGWKGRCFVVSKILFAGIIFLSSYFCYAQADYGFSQRWLNESLYNPAATANSFTTGVYIHSRAQWAGTEGAPITQAATFDTYLKSLRSAFGIVALWDKIGYINTYLAKANYAFYAPTGTRSSIAFGLSFGVIGKSSNLSSI